VVAESEDDFQEGPRYRTLFVQVDWAGGEPAVREPDKCGRWGWFAWNDPPQPLFPPVASLRASGCRPSAEGPTSGVVEAIHVAAAAGEPVREVEHVRAKAGVGLEGDRYALGRGHYSRDRRVSRDLTLIEAEVIDDLARSHGMELAPGETRRNVTTRGIRLNDLVGRRFWVGEVVCEATRLCEPCQYLTDLTGKPLLRALVHRGGLRADIVRDGRAAVDQAEDANKDRRAWSVSRRRIGILVFDGAEVLAAWSKQWPDDGVEVFTVARSDGPVTCAKGLRVLADHSPETAPPMDLLIVPGGRGARALVGDEPTQAWLRQLRKDGVLVTSVCTGPSCWPAPVCSGTGRRRPGGCVRRAPGYRPDNQAAPRRPLRRRRRGRYRRRRLSRH
jgi:MOSC domain-containing protein YiiM